MNELLREPDVLCDVLRRRLLRSAFSAVTRLAAVASGRSSAEHDELRACAILARLAPQLIGELKPVPDTFEAPEWWTREKVVGWEGLDDESITETYFVERWARCFRHHGPQPPHFSTLAEARDYGRRRWQLKHAGMNSSEEKPVDVHSALENGDLLP